MMRVESQGTQGKPCSLRKLVVTLCEVPGVLASGFRLGHFGTLWALRLFGFVALASSQNDDEAHFIKPWVSASSALGRRSLTSPVP
eukprot:1650461-Pyramimonas_sp.AAC.1